jgi:hypothetical protein
MSFYSALGCLEAKQRFGRIARDKMQETRD